jgi:hypothetical protein
MNSSSQIDAFGAKSFVMVIGFGAIAIASALQVYRLQEKLAKKEEKKKKGNNMQETL